VRSMISRQMLTGTGLVADETVDHRVNVPACASRLMVRVVT